MIPVLRRQFRQHRNIASGGGFIPTDLGSILESWWEPEVGGLYDATTAGSLVTSDGSSVFRMEDQSGKGRHLKPPFSQAPILKLSIVNGKRVLRFNGTDQLMIALYTLNFPITVVICYSSLTIGVGGVNDIIYDGGSSNKMDLISDTGGGGHTEMFSNPTGGFSDLNYSGNVCNATFGVVTSVFSASSTTRLRLDATQLGTTTGNGGGDSAGFTLASKGAGFFSRGTNIDVAGIATISSESSADYTQLEAYFKARFATP